jgi:RNAse (barnase) inhibitor barstar
VTARRCRLDGRQRTKQAVLSKIGRDLGWGRPIPNLDALYDVLRAEIPGPIAITWRITPQAHVELGADLTPITATLREVAAERPDLTVEIEP